ncbi:MAG: hypothetical protein HC896_05470 [Bacteroidales bacterium]|nr:hypothetical protein [Bacteroidales bacterium]
MNCNDDEDRYEMTSEQYDWWDKIIEQLQENSNKIYEIESNLYGDDLESFRFNLDENSNANDLEWHVRSVKEFLNEWVTKINYRILINEPNNSALVKEFDNFKEAFAAFKELDVNDLEDEQEYELLQVDSYGDTVDWTDDILTSVGHRLGWITKSKNS